MLNKELDTRQSLVQDFINSTNRERELINQNKKFENSPEMKLRKLNSEKERAKSVCIDTILGNIYRGALPYNDPHKNYSDDQAASEINGFISNRTGGHNSEYYIREALKKTKSHCLNNILTEAEKISKKFYNEKYQELPSINMKDINFNPNAYNDDIKKSLRNMDADEIADAIAANVKKAMDDEESKVKKENDYAKSIEDKLANNSEVIDDTSMESAMKTLDTINRPRVYQPSLFEGILLGKTKHMTESSMENVMIETVREYTKLNLVKALKLERFTLDNIRKMANNYLVQG